MRDSKRDVQTSLKGLRLNGMASAWADLMEQDGGSTIESSRWLLEHLLEAEDVDRHMRSISHQMKSARFPMHRDLAGFDFSVSQVDKVLIQKLAFRVSTVSRSLT
jgi:DNA replication protein DnaC